MGNTISENVSVQKRVIPIFASFRICDGLFTVQADAFIPLLKMVFAHVWVSEAIGSNVKSPANDVADV